MLGVRHAPYACCAHAACCVYTHAVCHAMRAVPQVLKETRATYRVVCEGVINLADKFFEMDRTDALKVSCGWSFLLP